MTTIKVQASYLEKHFQSDMESRGLSGVFDRNYPGTGPYSSGEDFFKYFWQIEEDNLFQKAQNKIEKEWINSGRMTKKIELINNNFDALVTLTFKNETDSATFNVRDCADMNKIEKVLSSFDPYNYKSNMVTIIDDYGITRKKYRSPTKHIIGDYQELLDQYFSYSEVS